MGKWTGRGALGGEGGAVMRQGTHGWAHPVLQHARDMCRRTTELRLDTRFFYTPEISASVSQCRLVASMFGLQTVAIAGIAMHHWVNMGITMKLMKPS